MGVAAEQLHEPLHGGGDRLAAGVDDAERPHELVVGEADHRERPGGQFAAHRRLGEQGDAGVDLDGPLDRFDVVELHDDGRFAAMGRNRPVDLVADDEAVVEGDHPLAVEFTERHLHSARKRVAGGADEHHWFLSPRLGLDRPRAPRITHDADIGLPLLDRLEHAVGMEVFESHIRLRMPAHELLHVAAHVVEAHGIDCGHSHAARHLVVECADLIFEGIVGGNDLAAAVVEHLAFAGGRQWPLRSFDQPHAEVGFELAHHLAGRRLRNAIVGGSLGKAAPRDDVSKDLQRLQVHRSPRNRGQKTPFRLVPDYENK